MPVVTVRTDNAKEYQATQKELLDMGVTMEPTSTYTAYQNGIAERFNRTVIVLARSMLIQSGLPLTFWAEAVTYACHIYNRLPQRNRGSKSPDKLWFKKKPDLSKERVFLAKKQRDTKLDTVNYLGIHTGYHSSTQYRVYRPDKNRFEWPTNVKFYEDRKGLELLPKGLLPKFDWLRADVPVMNPNHTEASNEVPDVLNDAISSDDDDQDDAIQPGGHVTSLPTNDQNTPLSGPEPEGDFSQENSNTGEDPQPGPQDQQNEGSSHSLFT